MEDKSLGEIMDALKENIGNFLDAMTDIQAKNGEISPERAEISKEKTRLKLEMYDIERKLQDVTDNKYPEIGRYVNDYYRHDIEAMKELYDRCKKYLDDNNLPYTQEDEDKED